MYKKNGHLSNVWSTFTGNVNINYTENEMISWFQDRQKQKKEYIYI